MGAVGGFSAAEEIARLFSAASPAFKAHGQTAVDRCVRATIRFFRFFILKNVTVRFLF